MRLAETSRPPWAAAAAALQDGQPLADACAGARLHRAVTARLTAPAAGAWVELLDGVHGARVLVVEHSPGPAGMRIAAQAGLVGFAETDDARAGFRRTWLAGQPARLLIDAEQRLAAGKDRWDLVMVDGLVGATADGETATDARLRELAAGLAPGGRLVVVADNRLSALRAADRAVGKPAGPAGPSLRAVERALQGAGLAVVQRFGLLRSSVDGVTAFDLDAPRATAAVLSAAAVRTGRFRTAGLDVLGNLARRGTASSLLPACMVVACQADAPWIPCDRRPTGRLGYRDSHESKVLRGEPPAELEKRYSSADGSRREAMALRTLEACGFRSAPRLVAEAPDRTRQTWIWGRPLRPGSLHPSEVRLWVSRAAQLLGEMHRATARDDDRVLVHGDYWLGNLLVEADEVVGVLDWCDAHWGEPAEDLRHLVDSLMAAGLASSHEGPALAALASQACRQVEPA